jgi:alpha-L-rhamnosidase
MPPAALADSVLTLTTLKTEYKVDPIGLDAPRPRFSWQLTATRRAQMQRAYQVLVASSKAGLDANVGDKWDSGRVTAEASAQIEYGGSALRSRARYYWKVRVWDGDDGASAWSSSAFFEMGLLSAADWSARWIAEPNVTAKSPLLRKAFTVTRSVRRARVYATALGLYELHLNGERVGQDYFTPGWTDYAKRLEYQTYDVTHLIVKGGNAIGAVLGDGYYGGRGWIHTPAPGTTRSVRVQLEIELTDDTIQRVVSDTAWRVSEDGPIQSSSIYNGELYDARKEAPGWARGGFDQSHWLPARDVSSYGGALVASAVPIRVMLDLAPVAVTHPAAGTHIFDMGQNMVGWARLEVQGAPGTAVRLRFGEMLNADGTLYTENLRGAAQTDTYVLRGSATTEVFEPHFTYHGFRYVEVTGLPGPPSPDVLTGRVAYAALEATGALTTSSPLLDRLYQNIVWSQRGNFWSVPTDCPQRDERMGYLGDGQIFAATAALNMDVSSYFTKWSQDIEDGQLPSGTYPVTAPVGSQDLAPSSARQEAGVVIPWTVYQSYGDTRIIERRWSSMVRFIDYLQSHAANDLLPAEMSVYDDAFNVRDGVPAEVVANLYYGYSVKLMAEMASATGRSAEAHRYDLLYHRIRDAFVDAYVTADGQVLGGTQGGYAMAIAMDMLPERRVAGTADYLVNSVRARGNHLTTGFISTKELNKALSKADRTEVAYELINQTSFPSWLFPVTNGATTLWERWDGWTPGGGFQAPTFNSFNHVSVGAVGEWMFATIAGISGDPQRPGYKAVILHPQPGGGLTHAHGEYRSIHGLVVSDWVVDGATFRLHAEVPANTTATVYVPAMDASKVREGGLPAGRVTGMSFLRMEGNAAVYSLGSGRYDFESDTGRAGPAPAPTPAPVKWTFCATEGETCEFTGTRQVRYGGRSLYNYLTVTASVSCQNGVFGDPAFGAPKQCAYSSVVVPTPWWTPGRVMTALGAMGAALLAGLGWVWSLRNTVKRQTEVIREKLAREAVASERSRIAQEIHDGLAQAVAGVSVQLEGVRLAIPATARVALDRLENTRTLVRQTLVAASRSIWEIQLPTEPVGLENALREMLKGFGDDAPVELSVAAGEPRMAAHTEYHVMRIAQEAVSNALRHAEGARVRVDLTFPSGKIVLRVTDDGPGFSGTPVGRGGLPGMRDRAKVLGGQIHVHSASGQGTEVLLEAPLRLP